MSSCFIISNQHGQYLSKQKEWGDGSEAQSLYHTKHKDEALNMVFELSSKDIYLRARPVACELNSKKHPIIKAESKLQQEQQPAPDTTEVQRS